MGRLLGRWSTDAASIVEVGGLHLARRLLRAGINECIALIEPIEKAMSHWLNLEPRAAQRVFSSLHFRG
jgi:hypothetical protein